MRPAILDGVDFRVRPAELLVIALADHLSGLDDDASDRRIRLHRADPLLRQLQSQLHELLVLCVHGIMPFPPAIWLNRSSSITSTPEFLRFLQLAAGVRAGQDVVGLLADAAGDLAAGFADGLLGLLAREALESPGNNDGLALEPARFRFSSAPAAADERRRPAGRRSPSDGADGGSTDRRSPP